jgi:AAA+ ATPase superfamily predicted ATPase/Holliday junction resolvase
MTFRTARPTAGPQFRDRVEALAQLSELARSLEAGEPRWIVLFGPRKIGKTSLLVETARRSATAKLRFVLFDVFDAMPVSLEVFRRIAARTLDACLDDLGAAAAALLDRPAALRATLVASPTFRSLPAPLQAELLELGDRAADAALVRLALELPEMLATALELHVVVALDEFQELAALGSRREVDPLPLMRSTWQRHERVAYVVSGSSRSLLTELVTSERSPFFQHFTPIELGPFSEADAVALLVEGAPRDRPIPAALAKRAFAILGGSPFYLQMLGQTLTTLAPPYDEDALKQALEQLLFSRTGRLSLYFEAEHQRIVGRSAGLAAALSALSEGPLRASEVGAKIRADSGTTVRSLERLADVVTKLPDGRYALPDPAYAAWLAARGPRGAAVPMKVLGDEGERLVAEHLASLGFDLVYQSRASRGAFDLLALRGSARLAVQVKRTELPVRFSRTEWSRMAADAKRFGWRFVVAVATPEGEVLVLDPARASKQKEVRLSAAARIENVPLWLDRPRRR